MSASTPERWQRIQELLDEILDLPSDQIAPFIAAACPGDVELQREVAQFYQACRESEGFLSDSPARLVYALLDESHERAPQRIGPYLLIREIGRGGMGTVWLAERADVQKRVALKLVSDGLHSPARVQRFLFERRVLARLEHPHIARLLDAGVTDSGLPWLAMEYIEGERIDSWCEQHKLATRERLALFEQVCNAVAHAHRNLIVHRDLKPSNILVTDQGEPRLVDFGIAKLLDSGTDTDPLTQADVRPMTPEYASPEQLRGAPITTASDVYQLGILLHELLTGRRLQTPAESLPAVHDIADRDIANIVRMAVDPDANRRYESAQQLRDDVRRYLSGQPVIARAATLGYRARKFIMRHKTGTAMSAALLLVVLASAALAVTQARRTARERDHAEQVSALLQDLFASSDPTVTAGDTITVRTVLERGAGRLADDGRLDAGVRARLLSVIATAYQNLGLLDRAIALQSEAVIALQAVLPADHPAFLQSRRVLGGMKAEDGQAKAVVPMLDSVLSIVQKKRRQNRGELAAALHITAWAHQLNQETDTARALYERALVIYRSMPADSGMRMVATLVNLGALARERDDLESAESLYREALALRRARLGNEHPLTAASMTALAATLLDRDKLDEAAQLARAALALQRRTLPSPHLDLAGNIELQASLLTRRGQFSEAEPLQREALTMYRALYGDRHVTVAHGTANLGSIVQRQGRLNEAVQLQRAAADMYGSVAGARTLSTGVALSNLAYTEFLRRRLPESEAIYRTALPVLDSLLKGSARLASLHADFAMVLAQQGKCDQAEPHARRSYELARTRLPENNVDVIRPQRVLGQCLVFLQRYSAAEPLLLDAHRKLLAGWGAANMYTRAAAQDLVQLYERSGRKQEADRFRR